MARPKKYDSMTQYKYEFAKKNYDRIALTVVKGRKAVIQAAADKAGQSVNAYINEAIEARLGGDTEK